jgi:hypothetical protein
MATEKELEQAILDVHGRRQDWHDAMDALLADAQAYSSQVRGRALPAPNGLGQLPPGGAIIEQRVGGQEAGDVRTTVISGEDVTWQNLANKLQDTRARGDDELDHLERDLNAQLAGVRSQQGQGGPGSQPADPTHDPQSLLPWADFLANIIAYGIVFYGLMAATQSFGLLSVFVGVGMLALTGILQGFIINPLRAAVRAIIGGIVQILQDLVEFVGEWLNAVVQYFQGDLLKAILRIVFLAFALWVFSEAMKIPAFKGVVDYVGTLLANIQKWVNDQLDVVTGFIHDLRGQVRDSVKSMLGSMGDFGKQLQGDILGVVDQLFNGLGREVAKVRFEVLAQVDFTRQALGAQIDVFGQRFKVLPDEVRQYILAYGRARPAATLADQAGIMAQAGGEGLAAADFRATPWDVLDELRLLLAARRQGIAHDAVDRADAVIADILAVRNGSPPDVPDLDLSVLQQAPQPGAVTVEETPAGPVAPLG